MVRISLLFYTFLKNQARKGNRSDDKLIMKENTLSETVAKLKCGSYMWGARDDAVCNSALACIKTKQNKTKVYKCVSALYV